MRRSVFDMIKQRLLAHNPDYWKQGIDATGLPRHSTRQKIAADLRMLCYGKPADSFDVELCMSETAILVALENFTRDISQVFALEYMRKLNEEISPGY
ncbi:hypothetical protein U9M48_043536 [Paspalum notatum var. saurae]|uniref:Uncharacterized protein n=1 Tax=Paspalum notatum var. saurae TaxID=547442 RepID=A0AAQ3XGL6_PASNO